MALSAENVVKQYKVELLKELPLDEAIFFAMTQKADLFPLSTGNNIQAKETRAEKVTYFLQHVVEPSANTYLPKLLEVMKNSKVANLEKLAFVIEAALKPGTYIRTYVCTYQVGCTVCLYTLYELHTWMLTTFSSLIKRAMCCLQ